MIRIALGAGVLLWAGTTLLFSCWARMDRPTLLDRLRPYHPGTFSVPADRGVFSVSSLRDVIGPLARSSGDRLAGLFGVTESVSVRLRRIHSAMDATAFRVRQLLVTGASLVVGALIAAVRGLPAAVAAFLVLGLPVLTFLLIEQRLARASDRWKRDVALELPVVSEQIAMLLNAGYSLGAAISRLAARGRGCVAQDLSVVVNRVRQGVVRDRGSARVGGTRSGGGRHPAGRGAGPPLGGS